MDTPESDGLSQQEYLEERKELYKYQQAAYDSYEKTLVTLSGSFFTLTAAILTYLQKEATGSNTTLPLAGKGYLVLGLALFSVSLTILLGCFFMNAKGYTFEIERIERARQNWSVLSEVNPWTRLSLALYAANFLTFIAGLVSIIAFAKLNFAP
jgi:hypothetical protein